MNRKTSWELYLLYRNYKGNNLIKSKTVKKIFGYKKGTNIRNSKMNMFVSAQVYKHPYQYWSIRKNLVAVLFEDLPENKRKYIYKWGCKAGLLTTFRDDNRNIRFLIHEEKIPFWKLKKYEGYIV